MSTGGCNTRIYLAGTFERRQELRPIRDSLWKLGHEVISSWLDEVQCPAGMDQETFFRKLAFKDVAEVFACDLLIVETGDVKSEGKNTELGIALGAFQKKLIYLVGQQRSVFHYLADNVFASWDQLLYYIGVTHARPITNQTGTAETDSGQTERKPKSGKSKF